MSNILNSLHDAASLTGRIMARTKESGSLVTSKVTGKADNRTSQGKVTLAEKIEAMGCTPTEKRAIDIVTTAKKLEALTGFQFSALCDKSLLSTLQGERDTAINERDSLVTRVSETETQVEALRDIETLLKAEIATLTESLASATVPSASPVEVPASATRKRHATV